MYLKDLIEVLKRTLEKEGNRPVIGSISVDCNNEIDFDVEICLECPPKPKPSKWHSYNNMWPDDAHCVLVYRARVMIEAWYDHDEAEWRQKDTGEILHGVTDWRELPKPPKKGE
jgi:hypothetical protein